MTYASIPSWLTQQRRWCTYAQNESNGYRKAPDQSTRDLDACRTFEQVGRHPQLGFVTTGQVNDPMNPGHRLVFHDIDSCTDADGAVSEWALNYLRDIQPIYLERSPSGHGLHAITSMPDGQIDLMARKVMIDDPDAPTDKRPNIQLFGLGPAGYVTITGWVDGIEDLIAEVRPTGEPDPNWQQIRETWGLQREQPVLVTAAAAAHAVPAEEVWRQLREDPFYAGLVDADEQVINDRYGGDGSRAWMAIAVRITTLCGHRREALIEHLHRLGAIWSEARVHASREPERYARRSWIVGQVDKLLATAPADAAAGFEAQGSAGEAQGSAAAPNPVRWDKLEPGKLSTAPPPRDWLLTFDCGAGLAAKGIPAVLAAEGGAGKTMFLLQLAVCIAAGRRFLDWNVHRGSGNVALVLAEETVEEVWRRLHAIAEALELTPDERAEVERRVQFLALAGRPLHLLSLDGGGNAVETTAMQQMLGSLTDTVLDLVVVDPLARLFPDAETDQRIATYAVQLCEKLAAGPGSPIAIAAHHSSKAARKAGTADARGVTGLTDASRLALSLTKTDDGVELRGLKSNYGERDLGVVKLRRCPGGALRLATAEEQQAEQTDKVDAVLAAFRDAGAAGLNKGRFEQAMKGVKSGGKTWSKADWMAVADDLVHEGQLIEERRGAAIVRILNESQTPQGDLP